MKSTTLTSHEFGLYLSANGDNLFGKPCWITREATPYLPKHCGNWFFLWHFRVFPDPLWCTSAREQLRDTYLRYIHILFLHSYVESFVKPVTKTTCISCIRRYMQFISLQCIPQQRCYCARLSKATTIILAFERPLTGDQLQTVQPFM